MSKSRSYEPADLWEFVEVMTERHPERREEFHARSLNMLREFVAEGLIPPEVADAYERIEAERSIER
jgi:hypothetical protein